LLAASALLAACSEPAPPAPQPAGPTESAPAPAADTGTTQNAIEAIEACKLLPPEEVATIVGGKVASETNWTGPHCLYVIEVPTGTEGYTLHFSPVAEHRLALDVMSEAERGERVDGPWPEAWLGPKSFGEGLRIVALGADGVGLEVSGEQRREPIVEMARRAFERTH
jgi:hypothetical protein